MKKRAKPVTTTSRSRRFLEAKGYFVALVERTAHIPDRRPGAKPGATIFQKWDCFGAFDLIAVHPKIKGVLFVQTTSRDHQAERRNKVLAQTATSAILESGNSIEVHGWAKVGARGQRKTWQVTQSQLVPEESYLRWVEKRSEVEEDGEEIEALF